MLKEKAALFTIGQFAALHEINKKTLMWYDEIGLLKPACIKENGYRYYSYQQSAALETILMLRELNVSLDEIKQFMENRTIDNFASLLQEKITELNQTISHLRSIQKILINQQQDMDMLRCLDIAEISLVKSGAAIWWLLIWLKTYHLNKKLSGSLPKQKNTNFAVCMTLPMVPCFQWSIYIKENSASIVPYILKCLFLFPKEDCICSLPEHT